MHETDNRHWVPLDVVDCILEQLVDEYSHYMSTLKACSTVCRDFAPLCQKRIFAKVVLSDDDSRQTHIESLHRLEYLLSKKPQISDYIRTLKYKHCVDSKMADSTFIFSRLRFVTTFHLSFWYIHRNQATPSWAMITSSFKNAFFSFLSSNNIVRLTLESVDHIPRTIFGHLPGLLSLTTDWVTLDTSESEECHRLAVPKLKSLLIESGGKSFMEALLLPQLRSSIDFSLLEDIKVELNDVQPGMEHITGVISQSHRLRSIHIDGKPPFLDMRNTLSSCLHVESLKTLKSIKLNIDLENEEQDPYCHLSSELAKVSTTNFIQEIEISICVLFDTPCTTELRHWATLDEVLTKKGGFPALQRAKIEVAFYHYLSDFEDLKSELLFIRDNAFPSLSTWDQVEFSMIVETRLM